MHALRTGSPRISARYAAQSSRKAVVVRAEVKVTGEYNESDGKVSVPASDEKKQATKNADGTYYIDELDASQAPRKDPMSDVRPASVLDAIMQLDMKRKLRKQYVELGGSANTPMANNYFLYIILLIGGLAVSCKVLGYI